MTDQYAVIGNPIGHSKSPEIHTLFAKQTEQDLHYQALLAPIDGFNQTVMQFFEKEQGLGLNVTVPFKQDAWQLCNEAENELSDYARLAGAVNTLVYRQDKTILGTNTDGLGIVSDLENNNQIKLNDKNILILGAGGAVRGVIQPILEKHPKHVFIANRTESKAYQLADIFKSPEIIAAGGYDEIPDVDFDIVINGTAASLKGDIPPITESCVRKAECCYDMMYANQPTAFVQWAIDQGVPKSLDGLGMLIEQAAESFYIWRGVRPETAEVFSKLRQRFRAS
jgi:shikimate dehydrogenase